MTTAVHTEGPWSVRQSSKALYIGPDKGGSVATLDNISNDDVIAANARLIAAAPDLLQALKFCTAVCAGEVLNKNGLVNALEAARAAIAKATGSAA